MALAPSGVDAMSCTKSLKKPRPKDLASGNITNTKPTTPKAAIPNTAPNVIT